MSNRSSLLNAKDTLQLRSLCMHDCSTERAERRFVRTTQRKASLPLVPSTLQHFFQGVPRLVREDFELRVCSALAVNRRKPIVAFSKGGVAATDVLAALSPSVFTISQARRKSSRLRWGVKAMGGVKATRRTVGVLGGL